jgi:hypothetical protein
MTQTEINVQPPWLVAVETALGTVAVIVGVTILTDGAGDVLLEVDVVDDAGLREGEQLDIRYAPQGGGNVIRENIVIDQIADNIPANIAGELLGPQIIEDDGEVEMEFDKIEREPRFKGWESRWGKGADEEIKLVRIRRAQMWNSLTKVFD